ncbi:ribosomal-protein-alanine N-acetyltransferase [compost metagenome]
MITIRPMTHDDLIDAVAIERLSFGERWSVQTFASELENPSSNYFVALDGDRIVGYAGYWLILDEAHITTIAVHPAERRRSIGEIMLQFLIEHAAKADAKWLTLEVRVSNDGARKLYEKYGFTALGRRKGYYQDDGEDALVMWTENIWQSEYRERFEHLKAALAARLGAPNQA